MKKHAMFEWDQQSQEAFESIKARLRCKPVLASPNRGKSLVLYIIVLDHSLGALAQENAKGKQIACSTHRSVTLGEEVCSV